MREFTLELQQLIVLMQANAWVILFLVGGIWAVNLVNWFLLGSRLNLLGIYPRSIWGLPGILFSPILHAHFNHLFFNSVALFVLMNMAMLGGWVTFIYVTAVIVVAGGLAVWLVGRRALHIGASGLIMGYWGYSLAQVVQHPSIMTVVFAFISLYYFGGLFTALFPDKAEVSWEGHVFGCLAGLGAAYVVPILLLNPEILQWI